METTPAQKPSPITAAKRLARAAVPPREWVLNHVVNKLPGVAARMAAYSSLGVTLEDSQRALIMLGTEVWAPQNLTLGAGATIGRDVLLDARGGITIGRNVNISSFVKMQTAKHLVDDPDYRHEYSPITIGDRAWVGMGAMILGGVSIGEGAIVAAGAVVTKDVAPFAKVGGVPARPIGERSRDLRYELDYRPNWL